MGDEGVIAREIARRAAPAIRSVVHTDDLNNNPVLRISPADPDTLCSTGSCLEAWARSQLDMEWGKSVGQGGAGTTRLGLKLCNWLEAAQLLPHQVASVLIDEEFDDFLAVVDGELRAALGKDAPVEWFLKLLLTHIRRCIMVDRVSERSSRPRTP